MSPTPNSRLRDTADLTADYADKTDCRGNAALFFAALKSKTRDMSEQTTPTIRKASAAMRDD